MTWWKWSFLLIGLFFLLIAFIAGMLPQFNTFVVGGYAGILGGWPYIIGAGFYLRAKNRSLAWLLTIIIPWPVSYALVTEPA